MSREKQGSTRIECWLALYRHGNCLRLHKTEEAARKCAERIAKRKARRLEATR